MGFNMKQHKWNTDCILCEKGISHNHLSLEEMQSTTTKSLQYKEWQGLSDEEIKSIYIEVGVMEFKDVVKMIEQKLKEKNHGTT